MLWNVLIESSMLIRDLFCIRNIVLPMFSPVWLVQQGYRHNEETEEFFISKR